MILQILNHQAVIRQSSGSHQAVIRQAVIRQSLGSHQAVIRQAFIRKSLGSHQAVIRQSSGSHQAVNILQALQTERQRKLYRCLRKVSKSCYGYLNWTWHWRHQRPRLLKVGRRHLNRGLQSPPHLLGNQKGDCWQPKRLERYTRWCLFFFKILGIHIT
jgi:hypothetical protein